MGLVSSDNIHQIISNIKFIPDIPLNNEKELKFGHSEIAKAIEDIVLNTNQSMTIGLFGSWGTGKSSIVNSVQNLLENRDNQIPTIIFDVWKHKDDALRRTFLFQANEQLKEKDRLPKSRSISHSVSKIIESSEEEPKLKRKSILIPFFILFAYFLFLLIVFSIVSHDLVQSAVIAFLLSSIFTWITWLPKNLNLIITKNTTRIIEDKFSDPAQFEKEFIEIIKASKNKTGKVLIVFDNLDRVTEGKAIEVLTTIKTFLEPKIDSIIIFLIPCDHNAIQMHIKSMFFFKSNISTITNEEESAQEFLNKFFNCQLIIPEFVPSEFEQFTLLQLEKSGIPQIIQKKCMNDVAWIIVQAFRNSPRRIIHFVNDLSGLYILLLHRVEGGEFDLNFINSNLPQIAKFLAIEKKFPDCLKQMQKEGYANPKNFVRNSNFNNELFSSFKEFVEITQDIEINNIFLFSRFRLSDSEKKFPGIDHLFFLMDTFNAEEISPYFHQMAFTNDLELDFSMALKDELERKQIHNMKINFINSILYIKEDFNIKLTDELYTTIYNKINEDFSILIGISPNLIYRNLLIAKMVPDRFNRILDHWLPQLPNFPSKFLYELIQLIFSEKIRIPDSLFEKYFFSLNAIGIDDVIISLVCDLSYETQNKLLRPEFINKLIESKLFIGPNNGLTNLDKISPDLLTKREILSINKELKPIFNQEFFNSKPEYQSECIKNLTNYIKNNSNQLIATFKTDRPMYDEFRKLLLDISLQCTIKVDSLPLLIEFAILMRNIEGITTQTTLIERINVLLASSPDQLKSALNENLIKKLYSIDKQFLQQFLTTQSNIDYHILILSGLSDIDRTEQMLKILSANEFNWILICEKLIRDGINPLINPTNLIAIINKMTSNQGLYSVDHKEKFIKICNYTKCFADPKIIHLYIKMINNWLLSDNNSKNREKYLTFIEESTFIDDDQKREFIKDLYNSIVKEKRIKDQIITNFLSIKNEFLTDEEKNEFIQFLFDEIITQPSPDIIQNCYNQLANLKPQYISRKRNFDDIKLRINREQNLKIKTVLINGLRTLIKINPPSDLIDEFLSSFDRE